MYVKGKEGNYKLQSISGGNPDELIVTIFRFNENLEDIMDDFDGLEKIVVTDGGGNTTNVFSGFSEATSISLQKNGAQGLDEEGNDIIADAAIITLQKPDRIDALEEAVDMLTMAILSGEGE